jgi:hypothetical protein
MDYSKLLPYCESDAQRRNVDAVIKYGSANAAAKALGLNRRSIDKSLKLVKQRAALKGYAPEFGINNPGAPHERLKGRSELVNEETGASVMQWYKFDADKEELLRQFQHSVERLCEGLPAAPKVKTPKVTESSLLTEYILTDYHLGMYAWHREGGKDWDINIARQVLINAMSDMIRNSPKSRKAIFCNLGDFLHWDGLTAVTPTSGHVLDADTRFAKMVDVAFDLFIVAIDMLLRHHEEVHVFMCEGNHDLSAPPWLQSALKRIYRNNPRVTIDDTVIPFYAFLHGTTFLGYHHGHKKKNAALPGFFSAAPQFRSMWGQATYSYIKSGHLHHAEQQLKEDSGAVVERFPTLASADAHSARGGYVSLQETAVTTYNDTGRRVCRSYIEPRV